MGTPERVIEQVEAFEAAGVDVLLLQCSPQYEEMERFARQVIRPYRQRRSPMQDSNTGQAPRVSAL